MANSNRFRGAIANAERVANAAGIIGLPDVGKSEKDPSLRSLWFELRHAATRFAVGQSLRKQPQLRAKLRRVGKLADRLTVLLSDEGVFCFLQYKLPPEAQLRLADDGRGWWHVHAFASAIADVAVLPSRIGSDTVVRPLGLGRRSAFVHLVGSDLVRIYEKHSKEKVKFHRGHSGKGPVSGKFLAFVRQALSELDITRNGKPYAKETIVRAFTDAKRGFRRTHRAKQAPSSRASHRVVKLVGLCRR